MSTTRRFIVVDDDNFNNLLCAMTLESTLGEVFIEAFTSPEKALDYLQFDYAKKPVPAILFLDLNMPTLTGWEFLDEFVKLEDAIKSQVSIYILSSSVNHRDKNQAKVHAILKGFISKPLTPETILSLKGV